MENKNNNKKTHYVYTTKYTKTISGIKIVSIIRLQPNTQVLTREPNTYQKPGLKLGLYVSVGAGLATSSSCLASVSDTNDSAIAVLPYLF